MKRIAVGLIGLAGVAATVTGCVDRTPPPPDAPIPQSRDGSVRGNDPVKPDAGPGDFAGADRPGDLPPPPFGDEPLVVQETPEQRAFVEAYTNVGRPRIVVFVNRTLDGTLLPVNEDDARLSRETVETRDRRTTDARYADPFEPSGPVGAEYAPRPDVEVTVVERDLPPAARQIDYEAIETVLTDWLACGGKVEIISPVAARRQLTGEQVEDVESGRPRVMNALAEKLDADVLVQVSARPTRQTPRGLEIRLVAEAINVGRGGQSVGRAVVDIPPPLDKPRINKFTRFLSRVLMDRMIGTWENMPIPHDGGTSGANSPELLPPQPQSAPPGPSLAPAPAPVPTTTKDQ